MFDQFKPPGVERGRHDRREGPVGPGRGRRGHGHSGHGGHGLAGHGYGPFGGSRGFRGRGARVRRGDVRSAIVALLAEQPMHGYQVMQELDQRSGGLWRPSAGSIYPTLQLLEDEGLVRSEDRDGRRVFDITDAGRELAARPAIGGRAPWDIAGTDDAVDLRELLAQLAAATMQVAQVGSAETVSRASQLLTETRRGLYRLLAEDESAPPGTGTVGEGSGDQV